MTQVVYTSHQMLKSIRRRVFNLSTFLWSLECVRERYCVKLLQNTIKFNLISQNVVKITWYLWCQIFALPSKWSKVIDKCCFARLWNFRYLAIWALSCVRWRTFWGCRRAAAQKKMWTCGAKHSPPSFSPEGPFGQNPRFRKFALHLSFYVCCHFGFSGQVEAVSEVILVGQISFKIVVSNLCVAV